MYGGLRDVAPQLFLPGVDHVPADTVALLETTPRVIEAYMAGLNHEMSRELLWREYPTDLRGTWFRQFWDVAGQAGDPETLKDIPPLREWATTPLGAHLRGEDGDGQLILLVRGELLRRYPTTNVYAAPAGPGGDPDPATRLAPMFRGSLDPDVTFLGFALSEEAALGKDPPGSGWFFVFEQHPGEPRFGFDEEADVGDPGEAGRARLVGRAAHRVRLRRREQAARRRQRRSQDGLGPRRRRDGVADAAEARARRHPRHGDPAGGGRRMSDRASINAARTAAQTVEAENHALRDRLVEAKANLRRLQAELALLPGRVAELQTAATTTRAQADAAAKTRSQLGAQQASTQAQAAAADASVTSLTSELGQAQQQLNELVQEARSGGGGTGGSGGGSGGGGGGRPPDPAENAGERRRRRLAAGAADHRERGGDLEPEAVAEQCAGRVGRRAPAARRAGGAGGDRRRCASSRRRQRRPRSPASSRRRRPP